MAEHPNKMGFTECPFPGGCFYKMPEVVKEGQGHERPLLETEVTFTVGRQNTLSLIDGLPNDQLENLGFVFEKPLKATIGSPENVFMIIIEKCLMSMRKGEAATFAFDISDHLEADEDGKFWDSYFEEKRDIAFIYFVLELTDMSTPKSASSLTTKEKYNLALSHKEQGRKIFPKNSEIAFAEFSTALSYLITIPTYSPLIQSMSEISDEEKLEYDKLRCVCYLNLAACQAKSGNHDAVIDNCTKALSIEPENTKGLYRRGKAYLDSGKPSNIWPAK